MFANICTFKNVLNVIQYIFVLLLISFFNSSVYAQTYTRADRVRDIALQEPYIWYATEGGLFRWDKRDMTCEKIRNGIFFSVVASSSGIVWAGTNGTGIHTFDGNVWKVYTEDDGIPYDNISSVAIAPNGNVWVGGARGGASKFDGEAWERFPGEIIGFECPKSIGIESDGTVWFGSYSGSTVTRFDGETWETNSLPGVPDNTSVRAIATVPDGSIWFATGRGVIHYDRNVWKTYTEADGLPYNGVCSIAIDSDGSTWFGTYNKHYVAHFDGSGWMVYDVKGTPYGLEFDSEGILWAGMFRDYLARFENNEWVYYQSKDGPGENGILSIDISPGGIIWIGTPRGLSSFDGKVWETYTTENGLPNSNVYITRFSPDGKLWSVTGGGIACFDGSSWKTYSEDDGIPQNPISSIEFAPDGTVWVGIFERKIVTGTPAEDDVSIEIVEGGLYWYDGHHWNRMSEFDWQLMGSPRDITFDHAGTLWVVTDNGVYNYKDNSWQYFNHSDIGSEYDEVYHIESDTYNNVWISTYYNGVYWCKNNRWTKLKIPENSDLPGFIRAMTIDTDNILWIGADNGLFMLDGDHLHSFSTGKEDGNWTVNAVLVSRSMILVGTERGIYCYENMYELLREAMENVVVSAEVDVTPNGYILTSSYPNPFNISTTITFALPCTKHVTLDVFNITGQRVALLVDDYLSAGSYSVVWEASGFSSGVYFYKMKTGGFVETRRMTLLK